MDNSKYDYEELTKLSALGRLRLLFGSFGTTFLFVVLITFLTIPVSLFMYYQTYINRLAIERSAAIQQYEIQDRASVALHSLDETDRTIRTLLGELSTPDKPLNRDETLKQVLTLQSQLSETRAQLYSLASIRRFSLMKLPSFSLITSARADPATVVAPAGAAPAPTLPTSPRRLSDEMRMWVMGLVFSVLGITFIISIIVIFKTTNADVLKFAFDTVKTLLGFFIGVATTLIGTT